jgi:hypothetical protein
MNYFTALKIYNQGRGSYCSPKKGTPEHAAVLAIQNGGAPPTATVGAAAAASGMPPMPSKARIAELKAKGRALIAQRKADAAAAAAAMPKAKPPSATGVKMRRSRKTGSAVKLAVPKNDVSDPADPTGEGRGGIKMRNTRRKVKIAIPEASRPLPTTEFSRRNATTTQFSSRSGLEPTTQFSSRGGFQLGSVSNMGVSQFSTRSGGAGNLLSQPAGDMIGREEATPSRTRGKIEEVRQKAAASTINNAMKGFMARSIARGRPATQAKEKQARADQEAYNRQLSKADLILRRLGAGF